MKTALNAAVALMLAFYLLAGNAGAQSEPGSALPPEKAEGSPPASETAIQPAPGIIVTPPTPPPSQMEPQSCPDTGRKLELIG